MASQYFDWLPDDVIREQCERLTVHELTQYIRTSHRQHNLCYDIYNRKQAEYLVELARRERLRKKNLILEALNLPNNPGYVNASLRLYIRDVNEEKPIPKIYTLHQLNFNLE